jgi:hypothetical protein
MNCAWVYRGKTPYEHWHKERPSVKQLRIFGCATYVHIQKDQCQVLKPHTRKCVFAGYPLDRAGWMFYDPLSKKLIYSDSTIFDE